MATISVKDANNNTVALEKPLAPGRAGADLSRPVVLSSEDFTALQDGLQAVVDAIGDIPVGGGDASAANQVSGNDTLASIFAKIIAAPATEAKQDTLIAKDFATQTTLAAVLAKLSADPATQTTLAAILAKLIAAPATEAKQDTGNTLLSTIAAKDFATQTTLAAVLGKLSADPATQTTLAAVLAKLSGDPATQTTLASVLAAVQAAQPAGENHLGEVGGNSAVVGGSFSRQANTTAYASGQLIANTAAAGSVTPIACAVARKNAGTGVITGVRLSKSGNTLTNASFRVHLFKTAPTLTVGDAGTFAGGVNGVAAVALGYVDITMDQQYSDGAKGFASISAKAFDAAGGSQNIYALIEARAAYTPASGETFTLALEVLRD